MSGDCELQDLAYRYGLDSWTYPRPYPKMPVDATRKYFVMDHNRCVLCRRCIRACQELVGNYTLGLGGRGAKSMIVADMDVPFGDSSCISCGTCLQVCPTGALIDRRSAYRGHDVEVEHVKSVCAACSVGCGIELITRDNHVLRIDGDWDAEVNAGILCIAGRFEPLEENRRRIFSPLVRRGGGLRPATWDEALNAVAARFKSVDGGSIGALVSPRATNEAMQLVASVFEDLGAGSVGSLNPVPEFMTEAEGSLDTLDEADLFIVVGEDLSIDHQVAGIAIRRGVMNRGARMVILGTEENGMAEVAHYQLAPDEMEEAVALAEGAEAPVVVYGAGAGDLLPGLRGALPDKVRYLGLVPGTNGRGAVAAGLAGPFDPQGVQAAFVLEADDEVDEAILNKLEGVGFVVAQTCCEGPLTARADVVLPTMTWAEKSGTLTNTDGRVQSLQPAIQPPLDIKSDEEILEDLAGRLE
jgi:formate dehydrogenase major subunit